MFSVDLLLDPSAQFSQANKYMLSKIFSRTMIQHGHSETGKGRWFGGLLAAVYCGAALTSYILHSEKSNSDKMLLSTGAVVMTSLTVFVTCMTLVYSGERNSRVPIDGNGLFSSLIKSI